MATRLGLGPVFAFEWLMASRRWQAYAMRSLTVLLMLAMMALAWSESTAGWGEGAEPTIRQQAQVGKGFYITTSMVLLGLVGLAAPAATAGAICLDKARGNLTLLFATDLSDAEIVLGKLAARLVPVLGMVLCAAPVLAISTLFGGVDPRSVVGAILVVLACAVFGCSLALTLSVWGKKTHEVLMATYAFGILYLLAAPILAGLRAMTPPGGWPNWVPTFEEIVRYNPVFLVVASSEPPPMTAPITMGTNLVFFGVGMVASLLLIAVATWRVRRVVIRQLGRGERRARGRRRARSSAWGAAPGRLGPRGRRLLRAYRAARRLWPEPSLDRNPVLWRECQRKRPSAWGLAIWGLYALFCGGFSLYAILAMTGLAGSSQTVGQEFGVLINCFQVSIGLLLLSVSAATGLAEERQRGSLDVLLATPMPTRSIVWGKWWGAFRGVLPLLILPTAVTAALASESGRYWTVAVMAALILAYGAAITSLGLALATWIPRMGRAVGLAVGLYTFMSIGWIFLALIVVGGGPGDDVSGVMAGSPLYGVAVYSILIGEQAQWSEFVSQTAWSIFWAIAYLGTAAGLLLATLGTFNRCLGRVDDPTLYDREDGRFAEPGGPVDLDPPPRVGLAPATNPGPRDLLGSDA